MTNEKHAITDFGITVFSKHTALMTQSIFRGNFPMMRRVCLLVQTISSYKLEDALKY